MRRDDTGCGVPQGSPAPVKETKKNAINFQDGIISRLEEVQGRYGYLPEKALREVAEQTGRSLTDIYGVATFYKSFCLTPRGEHLISVCLGTACHVRAGAAIAAEFGRQLGIEPGGTTEDRSFTLETVACLGACALGPIVMVDGRYYTKVVPSMVAKIIKEAREGMDKVEAAHGKDVFPIEVSCPRCNHSLMAPEHTLEGHPSIRVTISFGRKHGWLRLSSLYGSYAIESEYDTPDGAVFNFFCPHCHAELKSSTDCADCGAPMVSMTVRGGGMIQLCSRRRCRGHMLDLDGANI